MLSCEQIWAAACCSGTKVKGTPGRLASCLVLPTASPAMAAALAQSRSDSVMYFDSNTAFPTEHRHHQLQQQLERRPGLLRAPPHLPACPHPIPGAEQSGEGKPHRAVLLWNTLGWSRNQDSDTRRGLRGTPPRMLSDPFPFLALKPWNREETHTITCSRHPYGSNIRDHKGLGGCGQGPDNISDSKAQHLSAAGGQIQEPAG